MNKKQKAKLLDPELLVYDTLPDNFKSYVKTKARNKRRAWNKYVSIYSDFETTTEEVVKWVSEKYGTEPDAKVILGCSLSIDGYDRTKPVDVDAMINKGDVVLSTNIHDWFHDLYELIYKKHVDNNLIDTNKNNITLNAVVYFHNLKFDGNFIVKYLVNEAKLNLVSDVSKLKQHEEGFSYFGSDAKTYNIKLKRVLWDRDIRIYINIEFNDSLKLLSTTVESLGSVVKMCEGKFAKDENGNDIVIDYNVKPKNNYKLYDENFWKYCVRDCLVIAETVENLFDNLNKLDEVQLFNQLRNEKVKNGVKYKDVDIRLKNTGAGTNFTIAGIDRELADIIAYTYIKKHNINNREINGVKVRASDYITKQPFKNYKKLQAFFYGGLVQFSSRNIKPILEPDKYVSNSIDVNSAYPYWCTKDIPFGSILKNPPERGTYITFMVIKIKWWRCYKEWEHLPIMKNWYKVKEHKYHELYNINDEEEMDKIRGNVENRYVNRIDEPVYAFYINDEWDAILKTGEGDWEVVDKFHMRSEPVYNDFFNNIYLKRAQAKKQGDSGTAQSLKIMLNAFYGSLGMGVDYDTTFLFTDWNKNKLEDLEQDEKDPFKWYCTYDKQKMYLRSRDPEHKDLFKSKVFNWDIENNTTLKKWFDENDTDGLLQLNSTIIYRMKLKKNSELADYKLCVNKAIALTITARQRSYVINTINELGAEHVVYCDTDSIYFTNLPIQKWKAFEAKWCDANELGKWKIEHPNQMMVDFWSGIAKKKITGFLDIDKVEEYKNLPENKKDEYAIVNEIYNITWSGANLVGDLKHAKASEKRRLIAERSVALRNMIAGINEVNENHAIDDAWTKLNHITEFLDEKRKYGTVVYNQKTGKMELDLPTNYMEPRYYRSGMTLVNTGTHITKLEGKQ